MNKNAELWLEDLETTDAGQAAGVLNDGNGNYCCLGRACVVYQRETGDGTWSERPWKAGMVFKTKSRDQSDAYLPPPVREWLGLVSTTGTAPGLQHFCVGGEEVISLAVANDDGATFKEIAAAVRENENLFEDGSS